MQSRHHSRKLGILLMMQHFKDCARTFKEKKGVSCLVLSFTQVLVKRSYFKTWLLMPPILFAQ